MSSLSVGRIFWAVAPGERGEGKKRPMVVASRRVEILRSGEVFAVVCSTDFTEPLTEREVRLPSNSDGRCITRLRADTVAVCDWTVTVPVNEIPPGELSGMVPTDLVREIFAKAGIKHIPER